MPSFSHQKLLAIVIERSARAVSEKILSWGQARKVATPATAATTHAERGLERGDKTGDSRHFLHVLAVTLDRLFERV